MMVLTTNQTAEFFRLRDALQTFALTEGEGANWLDARLIERFIIANPAQLSAEELTQVKAWCFAVPGPFFVMRHTGSCTIFMNASGTFAVRGTNREPSELVPDTPTRVEVTLLPFDGHIVCAYNPRFDANALGKADRTAIDAAYRSLSDKGVVYSAAALMRIARLASKQQNDSEPTQQRLSINQHVEHGSPASCAVQHSSERADASEPYLAPIEILRPAVDDTSVPDIPDGLAQIIAFKPRVITQALYS